MAATVVSKTVNPIGKAHIKLRLRLPLIWLGVLLFAAFFLPDRVWNTLLIGIGGLFIVAYAWVWQFAKGLHAQRRLRFGWVAVGDHLQEEFSLRNDAELPALWVEIEDQSNVPGYSVTIVQSLGTHQTIGWRKTAVCIQRGQFTLGPWSIRSGDPFGIFEVTRHYPVSREIIIHPPIHGHLSIPLPVGQSNGRVRARQRALQATVNAASVRQYMPNDPMHHIHWRTSARQGELFVRQFDLDAAGDIWILLDMQTAVQLGKDADGTEEHAVILAASLSARAIRQNRPVGIVTYGQQPQVLPPGQGQGHLWKILRSLALVHADGTTDLGTALRDLNRISQKGAAAIIITPNGTFDWLPQLFSLAQKGIQSNVTLLDRASFGGVGKSEQLRSAIRQLGFSANIIHCGEVGQPLTTQAQRGVWEFKVTAMGKAIPVRKPSDL